MLLLGSLKKMRNIAAQNNSVLHFHIRFTFQIVNSSTLYFLL